ncbi:hypothetical protein FBALC1_07788 [Flavobacteriales bacterium ALC-1]|nr:hypothetical protein FBALC1_07788 [Flavobacteriales bacterium ALC-1]
MKRIVIFSVFIIALSIMAVIFIKFSNDHTDCIVVKETTVSEDGLVKVTTTRHSCNENFNL